MRQNNLEFGIMPAMSDCEGCGTKVVLDNMRDGLCPSCGDFEHRSLTRR